MMAALREALLRVFESGNLGFELVSTGAYFAYLRHPFAGKAAAAVAKRLAQEHGLLALPGTVFGPGQEPYLRLAFANLEADRMGEVGDRLRGARRAEARRVGKGCVSKCRMRGAQEN